jgi:hypothetical protein
MSSKSTSCIITITQGDFNIIEQWIDYNISIGITMFLIGYTGDSKDMYKLPKRDNVIYINLNEYTKDKSYDFHIRFGGVDLYKQKPFTGKYRQNIYFDELLYIVKTKYNHLDYLALVDTDEYLSFNSKYSDINECFDHNLKDIDHAHVEMTWYGDNGHIYADNQKLLDKFTKPITTLKFPYIKHFNTKIIINNRLTKDIDKCMLSAHTCNLCQSVNYITFQLYQDKDCCLDKCEIELKHFYTRTLEDWIMKMSNNYDKDYNKRFCNNMLSAFFFDEYNNQLNEITEEKLKAIPKLLKKYNIEYSILRNEKHDLFRRIYLTSKNTKNKYNKTIPVVVPKY